MQRKLFGYAIMAFSLFVIASFILGLFMILREFVITFSSVIWPLAIAGILAMILRPVAVMLRKHLGVGKVYSVCLIYAVVILVLAFIASFAVPIALQQIANLSQEVPQLIERGREQLNEYYPQLLETLDKIQNTILSDENGSIQQAVEQGGNMIVQAVQGAGRWLGKVFGIGMGLLLIPIYLFFMLLSNTDLMRSLQKQLDFVRDDIREDILYLVEEFIENIVSFFRGQLVIVMILAVLFALGYTLIGLEFGFILGTIIGLLNLIPFLGTIFALITTLPIAYLQEDGGVVLVLLSVAVLMAVQFIQDYVLTPKIKGKRTGLSQIVIIISIFFWGVAFNGLLGVVLAIPLTSFLLVFWSLLKRRYLEPQLSQQPQEG